MDSRELQRLLGLPEGPKLEFKQEFYAIHSAAKEMHWNECIKDILALANTEDKGLKGYLIIGVEDKINSNGSRDLHPCGEIPNQLQILDKVNHSCNPPLSNLELEKFLVRGIEIAVIVIPSSPHLHETTKDLKTTGPSYSSGTVFIRRGEGIRIATQAERDSIRKEKQRIFESNHTQRDLRHLERQIKNMEERIEGKDADLSEQRLLSTSDEFLEQTKNEIALEKQTLEYLRVKRRFKQSLLQPSTDIAVRGNEYFRYASRLTEGLIDKVTHEFENIEYLIENVRDLKKEILTDAQNALGEAISYDYTQPWPYYRLMEAYELADDNLSAYDTGCRAVDSKCRLPDLHQLHIKICRFVMAKYKDLREEAEGYIEKNRQILFLMGIEVDDEGQPL